MDVAPNVMSVLNRVPRLRAHLSELIAEQMLFIASDISREMNRITISSENLCSKGKCAERISSVGEYKGLMFAQEKLQIAAKHLRNYANTDVG